jgi:hypothetical protein
VNRKVQLKPLRWRHLDTPDGLQPVLSTTTSVALPQAGPSNHAHSHHHQHHSSNNNHPHASQQQAIALGQLAGSESGRMLYRQGSGAAAGGGGGGGGGGGMAAGGLLSLTSALGSFARPSLPPGSPPLLEEALLVVKWGGVLTHAGRLQAEQLGAHLAC